MRGQFSIKATTLDIALVFNIIIPLNLSFAFHCLKNENFN